MKKYKLALHIFHRDLRLQDNTALIYALKNSEAVIPCFVIDKRQAEKNPYKSANALQFMISSLRELNENLKEKKSKLYLFYGISEKVISSFLKANKIDLLTMNRDYTPFARQRDEKIIKIAKKNQLDYFYSADTLINEPEEIHKDDQKPYLIYTPFYKKAKEKPVKKSQKNNFNNYYKKNLKNTVDIDFFKNILKKKNKDIFLNGGRKEAEKLLKNIKKLKNYKNERNFPAKKASSNLSAHLKFGTLSVRELYEKIIKDLGKDAEIIKELYWRDFFTHIIYHFPHVLGKAFHKKYEKIKWEDDKNKFKKWCEGKTGFPIVDAGMRELNETGYMHNRLRMITASFLVKDLHINWLWGEKYFAQKLLDYDPAVNNGNWQWAASTGCDAQPYFRIFNPWRQMKRFDPDCEYIKKWLPELKNLSAKEIFLLETKKPDKTLKYYEQVVNHQKEAEKAKKMMKKINQY